jgi:hypothetical protein
MDALDLEKVIKAAFAKTPKPGHKLTDTYDDEGAQEYFEGRTWDGHSTRDIRSHADAMSFFTPEAFRYYLPAFMLAELREPDIADIVGDYVVYKFGPPTKSWQPSHAARLSLLTTEEKQAILLFIRYMQNKYGGFEIYLEYAEEELTGISSRDRTR